MHNLLNVAKIYFWKSIYEYDGDDENSIMTLALPEL